jgi:vacuolar-type H+-ATPase subunit D/Vma8
MGRVLQLASFSLAEVTYTAGDIGYQVQESVRKATYTVQAKSENVSGVQLPAFEAVRGQGGSGEPSLDHLASWDIMDGEGGLEGRSSSVWQSERPGD